MWTLFLTAARNWTLGHKIRKTNELFVRATFKLPFSLSFRFLSVPFLSFSFFSFLFIFPSRTPFACLSFPSFFLSFLSFFFLSSILSSFAAFFPSSILPSSSLSFLSSFPPSLPSFCPSFLSSFLCPHLSWPHFLPFPPHTFSILSLAPYNILLPSNVLYIAHLYTDICISLAPNYCFLVFQIFQTSPATLAKLFPSSNASLGRLGIEEFLLLRS